MSLTETRAGSVSRAPRPSSLADVLDLILDKGLVIDAYVRVSLAGIELLTIDARVVVASVDTYLRFAEAVNRLDLTTTESPGLKGLTKDLSGRGDDEGDEQENEQQGRRQLNSGADGKKEAAPSGGGQQQEARSGERSGSQPEDHEEGAEDESGGMLRRLAERARFEQ